MPASWLIRSVATYCRLRAGCGRRPRVAAQRSMTSFRHAAWLRTISRRCTRPTEARLPQSASGAAAVERIGSRRFGSENVRSRVMRYPRSGSPRSAGSASNRRRASTSKSSRDSVAAALVAGPRRTPRRSRPGPGDRAVARPPRGPAAARRRIAPAIDHKLRRRPDSNWEWSCIPYHLATSPLQASGWSGYRESNSDVQLGKLTGYHYITPARRGDGLRS